MEQEDFYKYRDYLGFVVKFILKEYENIRVQGILKRHLLEFAKTTKFSRKEVLKLIEKFLNAIREDEWERAIGEDEENESEKYPIRERVKKSRLLTKFLKEHDFNYEEIVTNCISEIIEAFKKEGYDQKQLEDYFKQVAQGVSEHKVW